MGRIIGRVKNKKKIKHNVNIYIYIFVRVKLSGVITKFFKMNTSLNAEVTPDRSPFQFEGGARGMLSPFVRYFTLLRHSVTKSNGLHKRQEGAECWGECFHCNIYWYTYGSTCNCIRWLQSTPSLARNSAWFGGGKKIYSDNKLRYLPHRSHRGS